MDCWCFEEFQSYPLFKSHVFVDASLGQCRLVLMMFSFHLRQRAAVLMRWSQNHPKMVSPTNLVAAAIVVAVAWISASVLDGMIACIFAGRFFISMSRSCHSRFVCVQRFHTKPGRNMLHFHQDVFFLVSDPFFSESSQHLLPMISRGFLMPSPTVLIGQRQSCRSVRARSASRSSVWNASVSRGALRLLLRMLHPNCSTTFPTCEVVHLSPRGVFVIV